MCGRFVVARASSELVAVFNVDIAADNLAEPSWNIAPTDRVNVVIDSISKSDPDDPEPVRRLESARWGLVPGWAKDPRAGAPLFNARIESAHEKPAFRNAVKKRRAMIPASGYYEWRTAADGTKAPIFIHLPDGELLQFAALYEWWRNPDAAGDSPVTWLLSTSIVTRKSAGELEAIHDRMPVLLPPELVDEWLDPHVEGTEDLLELASQGGAAMAEVAEFYQVGAAVGSVRNNEPSLLNPV
ncbi:MAG: hypothetical protein JWP30_1247 [Homoserinimonas sp.]|jgi:putative SOS response-associated peptidase YedK|nr:hypothetical protein [Homoserinimonas sp.]